MAGWRRVEQNATPYECPHHLCIRRAQKAWLAYRKAWLEYARQRHPQFDRASLAAWLNAERLAELRVLAGD